MAENKQPLITVDTPPRHINFATLKKQGTISKNNNKMLQSPMVGDRIYNAGGGEDRLSVVVDTARMQLISPPPEEMLRKTPRLNTQFTPSLLENTGASAVISPTHATTVAAKRKRTQPAFTSSWRDVDSMNQVNDSSIQSLQPVEVTPNPKPRKQGRLHSGQPSFESPTRTLFGHSPISTDDTSNSNQLTPSRSKMKKVVIKSPHAKNPDADFIDNVPALILPADKASGSALRRTLLGARPSRRSATPIPPYEPPKDVFTPPREVFLTPVLTKSSKRKIISLTSVSKSAKGRKKGSNLTIVTGVKQELPDIDLSLPMPPPSPTDDPLLLSGPPEPEFDPEPTPPRRREVSVQAQAEQEVDVWGGDLPPSSPEPLLVADDAEAVRVFDWNRNENAVPETSTDDSMMQLDPDDAGMSPVRLFDVNDVPPSSNGGWSDSEDEDGRGPIVIPGMEEGEEGEGEYTGHWKMMLVRTKQDPPSSATRERMEEWGRPISPFPKKVPRLSFLEEEKETDEEHQEVDQRQVGSQEDDEYMRREEEEREEEEVRQMSVEPEQLLENVADSANVSSDAKHLQDDMGLELSTQDFTQPIIPHDVQQSPRSLLPDMPQQQESEEEEEQEVRQMSVEFDDDEEPASPFDEVDPVPPQLMENPACGNQVVSIPAFQSRQPSPTPAIELFAFPSIGSSPEADPSSHSTPENGITPAENINENHQRQTLVSEQGEDDDQSSDDGDELSLVKITSADPRAAARAAAILKQYDYDCYTNIEVKRRHLEAKQRRNSHSNIEDLAKESRRRDVSSSGVAKASRRRSTLGMGVIGDRVIIPGSPAITLPELLQEAELEVRGSPQSLSRRSLLSATRRRGDPFKTPITAKYRVQTTNTWTAYQKAEVDGDISERPWTKEDWKYLDACFTDQRLEVGSMVAGAEEDLLAPVDMVSINDVVDKFVDSKGGFEIVTKFGALWSRENLLERTRALQKKQRSGHIAPPTTPYTPLSVGSSSSSNVLGGKERAPRMQVPDFTPLGRRAAPPRKSRPTLQQCVTHDTAFNNSMQETTIPPTLLAPRYSHLLEEAITISQQGLTLSPEQEREDSPSPQSEIEDTSYCNDVPSKTTIGNRVKGFLFSYLPTLPKSSTTTKKSRIPLQPSLPIPPMDILAKPRGPVITPARPPVSKPKHPKELVVLHPAPRPSTTISQIPRKIKPRRLVELHPPAAPVTEPPTLAPRPRRSSGNSVKDLVRGFEEMQKFGSQDKLKRTKSNEGARRSKPHWKP